MKEGKNMYINLNNFNTLISKKLLAIKNIARKLFSYSYIVSESSAEISEPSKVVIITTPAVKNNIMNTSQSFEEI